MTVCLAKGFAKGFLTSIDVRFVLYLISYTLPLLLYLLFKISYSFGMSIYILHIEYNGTAKQYKGYKSDRGACCRSEYKREQSKGHQENKREVMQAFPYPLPNRNNGIEK